eukprot:7386828-Pyramimonas_sp.AAC.1
MPLPGPACCPAALCGAKHASAQRHSTSAASQGPSPSPRSVGQRPATMGVNPEQDELMEEFEVDGQAAAST